MCNAKIFSSVPCDVSALHLSEKVGDKKRKKREEPLDMEKRLTAHFTLGELMRSGEAIRRGIENVPAAHPEDGLRNVDVERNLRQLCECVLEPLRQQVGRVIVTSGYRCGVLNAAVGGSPRSYHLQGRAADVFVSGEEMCRKYERVLRSLGCCKELILEPVGKKEKRWIHVSI